MASLLKNASSDIYEIFYDWIKDRILNLADKTYKKFDFIPGGYNVHV